MNICFNQCNRFRASEERGLGRELRDGMTERTSRPPWGIRFLEQSQFLKQRTHCRFARSRIRLPPILSSDDGVTGEACRQDRRYFLRTDLTRQGSRAGIPQSSLRQLVFLIPLSLQYKSFGDHYVLVFVGL